MALFGRETERDQQRAEAWAQWFRAQNPYSLASLVLGIFSLIEFGALLIFGIAGIVLGIIALRQIRARADEARPNGARLAWTGIITSVLSLVIAALLYLRVFG
jgi:uncharacterized membrane protein SpoIIM required for sporulation